MDRGRARRGPRKLDVSIYMPSRFQPIVFATILLLTTGYLTSAPGQQPRGGVPGPVVSDVGLHVILLGTGIPLPNPERASAATLIVAGGKTVMVDTGRNSMVRLVQAGFQDVDLVLYTHFHSDHYSGLGEIMVNRGIAGVEGPMKILGPVGTRSMVDGMVAAYAIDTKYRMAHHKENWHDDAMRADVEEFEGGVIYESGGLKITMFDVDHAPIEPAVGYRFDYEGKSIVVSGDTVKTPRMIEMAKDCDVLVHEAMDDRTIRAIRPMLARNDPRRAQMLDDLLEYHTPTLDLAEIARDAGVKKLVLTHLIPSIPPSEAAERNFIRGMAEIYSGEIVVGRDGMVISLD